MFGALSDPTRRALLERSRRGPTRPRPSSRPELPITRQAVLKHLSALADAGLVDRERAGREVHYRVTPAPLSDAVSWMADVGGQWDERLASLRRTVDPR